MLEERFEITLEGEHDFVGFGARIQFGIGGQVVEEDQRGLAEFAEDAFLGQLAFDETAIGADHGRQEKFLGLRDEGREQGFFQRRIQLNQFFHGGLHRRGEVAFDLVERDEDGGQGQGRIGFAPGQGGADFVHMGVVFDELGNDDADVVDRQFAHEAGQQEHQFAVGFLPVLDDALDQGAEQFGVVFEGRALGFELRHAELQLVPARLDFFRGSRWPRSCRLPGLLLPARRLQICQVP